jgi:hypothetical protein
LAYFFLVEAAPPRWRTAGVRGTVLGIGLLVEVAYALDHCLYRCGAPGSLHLGPLSLLAYGAMPLALAALALAVQARHAERRRSAALLASSAFALNALLDASVVAGVVASVGFGGALAPFAASPWATASLAVSLLAFVPCILAVALALRTGEGRRVARRRHLAAAAAVATGLLVGAGSAGDYLAVGVVVIGAWRLALPVLVGYAIVRHQLFDLDVRLRWTVKQSTVAAVFLGVFFVVSNGVQTFFQSAIGPYLGIVAAGGLVFALAPLQRLADRVAQRAVPLPVTKDAHATYRDAVELALADGLVNRAEERALARLATQLGLDPERALAIREETEARHA